MCRFLNARSANLIRTFKARPGLYFRNKSYFTCLPVIDFGDLLFMHASSAVLKSLHSLTTYIFYGRIFYFIKPF